MDTYQAIYDAVRSRISGGDVGSVLRDVAREALDISYLRQMVQQDMSIAVAEYQRPSVLFRPLLTFRGDAWFADYGPVAGRGDSPDAAMRDFDAAWCARIGAPALAGEKERAA